MNYFRMRDTGQVVTEDQYRASHVEVFPVPLVPLDADPILESPAPTVSEYQTAFKNGVKQDIYGNWIWDWDINWMSDAEITSYVATKTIADAAKIQTKIDSLWASANSYVNGYISGLAVTILAVGIIQKKPKALAVSQWSDAIWAEYYNRKAGITATSNVEYSFDSFGAIPYTVPELMAEASS